MPAHPKERSNPVEGRHPGGPLKRLGVKAGEWLEVIGPSLDSLPTSKLPLVRSILQRYRALRIKDETAKENDLAKDIATEVTEIWKKARIPTAETRSCVERVQYVICLAKSCHNPGELQSKVYPILDTMFDLKP